jgi:ribosome-associated protein
MNKTRILPVESDDTETEFFWAGPSKSQRKRESTALQDMGEELVALSPERLKKIDIPDNLREALRDAQRFTQHGARRRQMQLIGKLMRSVDTEPLQAALDEVKGVSAAATARQHHLEKLRERLMADDAVFAEIGRDYPDADIQYLRQLRRNALKEIEQQKPPRAFRELFRQLRQLVEGAEKVGAGETAAGDVTDADDAD